MSASEKVANIKHYGFELKEKKDSVSVWSVLPHKQWERCKKTIINKKGNIINNLNIGNKLSYELGKY